jgi:hypothetical protein
VVIVRSFCRSLELGAQWLTHWVKIFSNLFQLLSRICFLQVKSFNVDSYILTTKIHEIMHSLSQHGLLQCLTDYPLPFFLLWDAVRGHNVDVTTAIEAVVFNKNYILPLCRKLKAANFARPTLRSSASEKPLAYLIGVLGTVCSCIQPHYYNIEIHKLLEWLLNNIPTVLLLKDTWRQPFHSFEHKSDQGMSKPFCGLLAIQCFSDSECIVTLQSAENVIDDKFALLRTTYRIQCWHHDLIKRTIFPGEKLRSFLTANQKWSGFVNIETIEMDQIKGILIAQVGKLKTEVKVRQSDCHGPKFFRRSHLKLFLSRPLRAGFMARKPSAQGLFKQYMMQVTLEPQHPAMDTIMFQGKSHDVARMLSQIFFGNIYRGHGCRGCVKWYRDPPIKNPPLKEVRLRSILRLKERKAVSQLKFRHFRTGLNILLRYFVDYYDEQYLQAGIWRLVDDHISTPCARTNVHRNKFSLFVKLMTDIVGGLSSCGSRKNVQIELQHKLEKSVGRIQGVSWFSNSSTSKMTKELVMNVEVSDLMKFLALATKVDIDCLCLGRVLERIIRKRKEIMYEAIMSLDPTHSDFIRIARSLIRLQGKRGGGRIETALRQIFQFMSGLEWRFSRHIEVLFQSYDMDLKQSRTTK